MKQPMPTPFDTGNQLLGEQPAQMATRVVNTPMGERLAMTIRTPSATMTVFLSGIDAKMWARQLATVAEPMSGSALVRANGALPKGRG